MRPFCFVKEAVRSTVFDNSKFAILAWRVIISY